MRRVILAVMIMSIVALQCGAQQVLELRQRANFKNDRLGMPLGVFQARHIGVTCSGDSELEGLSPALAFRAKNGEVICIASTSIVGRDNEKVFYRFYQDKLIALMVEFPNEAFMEVEQATRQRDGQPTLVKTELYQNGFGAKFTGRQLAWNKGEDVILLSEFSNNRSTSALTMIDKVGCKEADDHLSKVKVHY
jgi:hypothetical protein